MSRVDTARARLASAYAVYQEARDRDNWYGAGFAPRAGKARAAAEGEVVRALLSYVLAVALEASRRVALGLLVIALMPIFWIIGAYQAWQEARREELEWKRALHALSSDLERGVRALQGRKVGGNDW